MKPGMPKMRELAKLIGERWDSSSVEQALSGMGPRPKPTPGDESFYWQYQWAGMDVVLQERSFIESSEGMYLPEGDFVLVAIHFYSNGYEGYEEYLGVLPGGVTFGESRRAVEQKLGSPSSEGGGGATLLGLRNRQWIRYDNAGLSFRFQLNEEGRVEHATLFRTPVS